MNSRKVGKAEIIVKEPNDTFPATMGIKWEENGIWYGFYQEGWNYARLAFLWWLVILAIKGNLIAKLIVEHTKIRGSVFLHSEESLKI